MQKLHTKLIILIFILTLSPRISAQDDFLSIRRELDSMLETNSKGLFDRALEIKNIALANDDNKMKALADMYIGNYYSVMRIHSKALSYYFNALEALNKKTDTDLLSQLYSSIGATYRHLKDFEKAKQYAMLSFENSSPKDSKLRAKILNRIGDMHRDLGAIDSAFYFYHKSIATATADNFTALADNYNNLGDLFFTLKKYDSSDYYYNLSIKMLVGKGEASDIAENYSSLALLYLEKGNQQLAIQNITASINTLSGDQSNYELGNAYSAAIAIYTNYDIKDSLNKYLKLLIDYERLAASEQLTKAINTVELEQSLKNKDIQYKLLQSENKLKGQTNILLIIVVFLVIIAGALLWRQIHFKKAENKLLAEQNDIINKSKEEIQIAYNDIHDLNATKDKFFSIIAHDLRNPLGSFKMVMTLLYDQFTDITVEEQREFIGLLKDSSDNLYSLLENLLEWSRSQRGKIQLNPSDIDMYLLVGNTMQLLKPTADHKNIQLINNFPSPTIVYADSNLLTIVIRNLVSNAIKFTPDSGKVTVGFENSKNDDQYTFFVEDTGVGMTQEIIDKLFRLDTNMTTAGTSEEKGTGLGLILCKEFIDKQGGNIYVESSPGKGSKFIFTLKNTK